MKGTQIATKFAIFVIGIVAQEHWVCCDAFSLSSTVVQQQTSRVVLYSSEEPIEDGGAGTEQSIPNPSFSTPPPVPQRRLDPLMASLTRMDASTANGPTRNLPLLGEVPVDGSLVVLVPAAAIAVIGFIFSIVVAVNSQDALVDAFNQVADDIAQTASEKTNMVYDDNTCRGLCSSQQDDLEGLRTFMESLRK